MPRDSDPNDFTTCPYNMAHTFPKFRMQTHLVKCSKNYPELRRETAVCLFDKTHIVPKVELSFHHDICDRRLVLDQYKYKFGAVGKNNSASSIARPAQPPPPPIDGENWDLDLPLQEVSVLDSINKACESKPILRYQSCAGKASKRNFRAEEKRRLEKLANESSGADGASGNLP